MSTATSIGQPTISLPDYSALCDSDLKTKSMDTVQRVQSLLANYFDVEKQFESEKMSEMMTRGFDPVREFECNLLSTDRYGDLRESYTLQFASQVKALRIELSKRLRVTPGKGIGLNTAGSADQMYQWTEDLKNLANQLPASGCAASP